MSSNMWTYLDSPDNYSPDDYHLPPSPALEPFRLRTDGDESYISDSDEELDIVSLINSRTATPQY